MRWQCCGDGGGPRRPVGQLCAKKNTAGNGNTEKKSQIDGDFSPISYRCKGALFRCLAYVAGKHLIFFFNEGGQQGLVCQQVDASAQTVGVVPDETAGSGGKRVGTPVAAAPQAVDQLLSYIVAGQGGKVELVGDAFPELADGRNRKIFI